MNFRRATNHGHGLEDKDAKKGEIRFHGVSFVKLPF